MKNDIYNTAILGRLSTQGDPIFLVNITYYKIVSRGNKKHHIFGKSEKMVASGLHDAIINDKQLLKKCLKQNSIKDPDLTLYGISEITYVQQLGYALLYK